MARSDTLRSRRLCCCKLTQVRNELAGRGTVLGMTEKRLADPTISIQVGNAHATSGVLTGTGIRPSLWLMSFAAWMLAARVAPDGTRSKPPSSRPAASLEASRVKSGWDDSTGQCYTSTERPHAAVASFQQNSEIHDGSRTLGRHRGSGCCRTQSWPLTDTTAAESGHSRNGFHNTDLGIGIFRVTRWD